MVLVYVFFFFMFLNLIIKYVSYSAEISHLAVGCREGISLLVSDWLSQLSLRWAQSLLSDTAAHSHRQKYPANWMAYVRHSPQGTAPFVFACVQEKVKPWVNENEQQQENKKREKCHFFLFWGLISCHLGCGRGEELTYMQRKLGWWLSYINWTPKCPAHLFLRGLCGKIWIVVQPWRWKLWIVSTCGKGRVKYVGQIGLCQLWSAMVFRWSNWSWHDFTSVASSLARPLFVFSLML